MAKSKPHRNGMLKARDGALRKRELAEFFDELRTLFQERTDEENLGDAPLTDPLKAAFLVTLHLCARLVDRQEEADENGRHLRIPKRRGPKVLDRLAADLVTAMAVEVKVRSDERLAEARALGFRGDFATLVKARSRQTSKRRRRR